MAKQSRVPLSMCSKLRAYLLDAGATCERTTGGMFGRRDRWASSVEDPGGEGGVPLLLALLRDHLLEVFSDLPFFPHCAGLCKRCCTRCWRSKVVVETGCLVTDVWSRMVVIWTNYVDGILESTLG